MEEQQKRKFRRRKNPDTAKTARISLLMREADREAILDYCEADPAGRAMNTILLELILRGIRDEDAPAADARPATPPKAKPEPAAEPAGRTEDAPAAGRRRQRKPEEPGAAARRRQEGELLKSILPPEDLEAYNAETRTVRKGAYKRAVLDAHEAGSPLPRFAEWLRAREAEDGR